MRIVLDTCVVVSALRSHTGESRRLFDFVVRRDSTIRLVTSSALYLEYEAVLSRPEQVAAHGLSAQKIEEFLTLMASFTDHIRINYRYRPQLRDPNDEMVLEAAVNGRAAAIVTHNVRDFLPAASLFGIAILTPRSILEQWRTS